MLVRSETRTIRPFQGIGNFDGLLAGTVLELDEKEFSPGTLILPLSKLRTAQLKLKFNFDLKTLKSEVSNSKYSTEELSLVIFARSNTLRRSIILLNEKFTELDPELDLEIDRLKYERIVFADEGGFQIVIGVVLNKQRNPKPLEASRPGTWLGKIDFKLKPEIEFSNFSPLPLTKAIRERFSLKSGAYTYVDFSEDILTAEELNDSITFYLDEDVLNLLLTDESDKLAVALQFQLAVQAISSIVIFLSNQLRNEGQEITDLNPDSGASRFLNKVAVDCNVNVYELIERGQKDIAYLQALIESRFKMSSVIERALKDS